MNSHISRTPISIPNTLLNANPNKSDSNVIPDTLTYTNSDKSSSNTGHLTRHKSSKLKTQMLIMDILPDTNSINQTPMPMPNTLHNTTNSNKSNSNADIGHPT